DVKEDLLKIRQRITQLEAREAILLTSTEVAPTLLRLEQNIKEYKTNLIRFKREKQEK
ncbi:Hypothetical predicted protein, partial [Pelobates cultripes]